MNKKEAKFWDFDFEEMGLYDVPAYVELIKETTGQDKMAYVGHSEGTSQFFIGSSMMAEYYKEHFSIMVALAPIAELHNSTNGAMVFAS